MATSPLSGSYPTAPAGASMDYRLGMSASPAVEASPTSTPAPTTFATVVVPAAALSGTDSFMNATITDVAAASGLNAAGGETTTVTIFDC